MRKRQNIENARKAVSKRDGITAWHRSILFDQIGNGNPAAASDMPIFVFHSCKVWSIPN